VTAGFSGLKTPLTVTSRAETRSSPRPDTTASESIRRRWDARHAAAPGAGEAAQVLVANEHLLPARGRALDLACGLGANALRLAALGLDTEAWDLSPVAIERLRAEAGRRGLRLEARVRDVEAEPPPAAAFDVVVVSHFLARDLAPALEGALRPGGLLFYQTFTREAVGERGPSNPEYRLARNELLRLFPHLVVRCYREEGRLGDCARGHRDLAFLVGQRPS